MLNFKILNLKLQALFPFPIPSRCNSWAVINGHLGCACSTLESVDKEPLCGGAKANSNLFIYLIFIAFLSRAKL